MVLVVVYRDMYFDEKGNVIDNMLVYGIYVSGVLGSVVGMWFVY